MSGILEGIKVLSMGQIVAIPAASSTMADWGADVIKLEPLTGEMHRGLKRAQGVETGEINWVMQVLNRNKKSLALDLSQEAGSEIIYKLIRSCDIFMSNYKRSSMNKMKLDYKTLSNINPKLIYGFVSGYGAKGPDRDERGYDFTAGWARSGMMHLIGEPGTPPAPQRVGIIDSMAGSHLVSAICAALLQREKTGKGQEIEVSLYHTAVWSLAVDIQGALGGTEPVKHDRTKAQNPVWNSYETKDGRWFWLAMLQAGPAWPGFCRAIERPELENDPKFCGLEERKENCEELIQIIQDILATRTMADWEQRFKDNNCIYGRVQTPMEVINDPQALANDFFVDVEHPYAGNIKLITTPAQFSDNPATLRNTCPELGQHNEEILLELGYTWEDIAILKEQRVIL
ncbi:MAG: CoA transferase [Dehalococcoidales bacterium]|nr:CoA transferase [Dehalococcoidales bacterium]